MTMLLQNRTISMILTVPEVKELTSSFSHSVDDLQDRSTLVSKIHKPPSIPIYHGSILRIEQHDEEQNISDLIVRVPNYHHSPSSVTISTYASNIDQFNEFTTRRETSFKRRAPICPILNENKTDNVNVNQSESTIRSTNAKRLAIGLRNLSQAFGSNCKPKRSTSVNHIAIIPVLPDVEIITENFQISTTSKKSNKNRKADFLTPKILFIKRKCLQIKKKRATSKTDAKTNINDSSNDNEVETKPTDNHEVPQVIPNIPIIVIDSDSSSTHPYNTLDQNTKEIYQTETFILTDPINSSSTSDQNIDETVYVVHPNGDTYSECYEVTYQFDPEFQQYLDHKSEETYLSENPNSTVTRLPVSFNNIEDNSSHIYEAQSSIYQSELVTPEFEQTPLLNEDYTIIIELLKNVLQLNTTIDDGINNEFDSPRKID
ncbi:hypothetical protein I4U23_003171 [Adineta vaga]|nr:hypothetical protein I4U23_003171 [Adineta vaga]